MSWLEWFLSFFSRWKTEPIQEEIHQENPSIWLPFGSNGRKQRIATFLASLPYFFGTFLEDFDLHSQILINHGDGILLTTPRMENKRSNTHRKWLLIFLDQDKSFNKVEITYWRRDFVLKEEKSVKMLDFIGQKGLKMIPRPIFVKKDQIIDRTLKTGNLSSPIHDHLFMLGKMCSKILLLDENRKMPVFAVDCSKYKPKIQKALFEEAKKMLHFGSIRIWRLLAISKENHGLILVFEDIVHGSLMDHVRQQKRNDSELKKFALQMAEGLRYLEKFNFIHHRLSLECFFLTFSFNVKLAIYGFDEAELVSTDDGHDELDKCRWTAPECLFSVSHEPTEKYDLISMVFTFGNCLFSMFHGGFLPFEDESSQNIKNREWRMKNFPIPEIELMPKEIIEICQNCWEIDRKLRPTFKELKQKLRRI